MSELGIILMGGLVVLLALGIPIAFTLGILTIFGLYLADIDLVIFAQRILAGSSVSSLLAIPGFILAGDLMSAGGLSRRLVRFASSLMGHLSGGLSMATVAAGTFFGAISGSAPATTAAVGSVMIDEMEKRGYSRGYGAALAAGVGPIGQMIPPSIPMVIWAVLAEESVSKLFVAGIIPGLLTAAGFMLVSYFYAKRHNIPTERRTSGKELLAAVRDGSWALLAPIVILGGIYGGIFTPTEASMVGVLYGLIVGLFVYRDLRLRDLPQLVLNSMRTTATIMFIICMAYGFAWLMASEQIPAQLSEYLLAVSDNPVIILLLVNLLLLLLGAVMDNVSAMVILSGVLMGIGQQVGMSTIQLGAMVVINFAVGMVTPPVGYSLFVSASISGLRIETVSRHLWPFLLVLLGVILAVTFIPAVTTWLPEVLV